MSLIRTTIEERGGVCYEIDFRNGKTYVNGEPVEWKPEPCRPINIWDYRGPEDIGDATVK